MRTFYTVLLALSSVASAPAKITLPSLYADHMLIQRGKDVPIDGYASPGSSIRVELAGQTAKAKTTPEGTWRAMLPPLPAGGPHEMKISGDGEITVHDVMVGDVWLASGQSNMNFHMAPYLPWTEGVLDFEKEIAAVNDPGLRVFTVPIEASAVPLKEIHGVWQVANPRSAGNFYGVAYYFAKRIREETGVPIAIIQSARGSTSISPWMDRATLETLPNMKEKLAAQDKKIADAGDAMAAFEKGLPAFREKSNHAQLTDGNLPAFHEPYKDFGFGPTLLYNAMIAPLTSFPVKGFLWYQGESDIGWSKGYGAYFKALITSWRKLWHEPDAPFLFVQISNYDPLHSPESSKQAGLRPGQRLAQATGLELPRTAMATAVDAGDPARVHPRDKKKVGDRLARAALALAYGKDIAYRGPQIESAQTVDGKIVLTFRTEQNAALENARGGEELSGFDIAGADGVFHPAKGKLEGMTVTVSAPDVPQPAQVRYLFADDPPVSLYDSHGLPCPPFVQGSTQQ